MTLRCVTERSARLLVGDREGGAEDLSCEVRDEVFALGLQVLRGNDLYRKTLCVKGVVECGGHLDG